MAEDALSRRSFLGITSAENMMASSRSRRIQPQRRHGKEFSPVNPQPPIWNRPVERRNFLIGAGVVTAAGYAAVRLRPWEWLGRKEFMEEEVKKLGREINAWKLKDGTSMAAAFPEIKQAADMLEGRIDPRKSIPQLKIPIELNSKVSDAAFSLTPSFDTESSRQIRVKPAIGDSFKLPFIKPNAIGSLELAPEILGSSLRLPIAAKEASQIVDHLGYCRVYVSLLKERGGAIISLENPDNIPTSDEEFITSVAYAQAHVQMEQAGSSWFYDFVDFASHIRVGGIAFANWYVEELNSGRKPQGVQVEAGNNMAGFLQFKNLIEQKSKGGMFVWPKGRAPEVNSKELMDLFEDYTGRTQ